MTLAYSRAGSGPPLVLIHGLGHRRQGWDPVLGLLTPHRDVIAVDLPGHGESPALKMDGTNGTEAVALMADALADLLGTLELDQPPHLGGNSLGGALALVLAARGLGSSATALSPAGFFNNRLQFHYARWFFEFALVSGRVLAPVVPRLSQRKAGKAVLLGGVVARPALLAPQTVRDDMAGIARAADAVHAVLRTFQPFTLTIPDEVPVTIGWGSKDRLLSPKNAVVARQRLPQARFLTLPGCGHVPMSDDPELVARTLLEGSPAS
jgi:pimeloyl-ACP methyl ester carboxylesterase